MIIGIPKEIMEEEKKSCGNSGDDRETYKAWF